MSDHLQDLMDDFGWTPQTHIEAYNYAAFKVIRQLVSEVRGLKAQVEALTRATVEGESND